MSAIKVNQVQIGQSATANNNFTFNVPTTPDGTIKLSRGVPGALGVDVLSVGADGKISFAPGAGVGDVTLTGTQTLTNKTIQSGVYTGTIYDNGSVRGVATTVIAWDIDCSVGNYFTKAVSTSGTFTFTNAPTGVAYAFTLEITHSSGSITWPSTVAWANGVPPSLTAGKAHLFVFVTDDAGARWRGVANTNFTI